MAAPKLIATDLDGTFLSSDHLPTVLNLEAVRVAHARGVHIVFATGRPARWLQVLDPLADLRPGVIASNGAVLYDIAEHQVTRAWPLPRQASLDVMADVEVMVPGAMFAVEYVNGWGRLNKYPPRGDFVEANVITDSPEELFDARVAVKLLIMHAEMATEELFDLAAPVVGGRLDATFSWMGGLALLELSAPGVSKGSALLELMGAHGIHRDEVVAFGDMPNDIPMLEVAGCGYAMANSHPMLLARGYPSAGRHDEDGFGRTVMNLLNKADLR